MSGADSPDAKAHTIFLRIATLRIRIKMAVKFRLLRPPEDLFFRRLLPGGGVKTFVWTVLLLEPDDLHA